MQKAEKLRYQHGEIFLIVLIEALLRSEPPLLSEFVGLHQYTVLDRWGLSKMQVELVVNPWDHEVARGNAPVAVNLVKIGDHSKVLAHVEKVGLVHFKIELPKVLRARDR